MSEGLEDIVRELSTLAKRKPLKGEDLVRVKELMARLKEMGFTNKEISDLTNGGWSEPTIKLYTRGVGVKDPTPKENALRIISQMVNKGLTLKDVEVATSIKSYLDTKGISLEDISTLLEEVKKSKIDLKELIQIYRTLKDSGLSITQLAEALSYKSELEKLGVTVDGLKEIYTVSKAFGGYSEVIKAISTYGSIKAIEVEVKKLSSEKEGLEKRVDELKGKVKELEGAKTRVEEGLKTYENLRALGFDDEVLKSLKNLSDSYGGVKAVVEAVKVYGSLVELKSEVKKLEEEKSRVEAELKKVKADYAYLQTVIGMCDTLLHKLNFSIPAITEVYEVAKKYGEPIEVLKAIGKYGELKAIEGEVERLTTKKNELELRVKELSSQVQELRALIDELKNTAKGMLKPFVKELEKSMDTLRVKFSEALDTVSSKYEEYVKRFSELKAECGRLEEELRLARVIQALIKYPSECKEIPLDYDILMLKAIISHCRVKGVNPKVRVGDAIGSKYLISSSKEFELLDILELALRGLEIGLAGGRT
jgi:DNA repair exonuclease SbcCD ATPase subunit